MTQYFSRIVCDSWLELHMGDALQGQVLYVVEI